MFKKIFNIFTSIAVGIVVILALLLVGVRLIGFTPYTVISGSMEPMYHVGSLIYVRDVDPEDVQIGDAITFVLNEDLVVATHQVYDIDYENSRFYTQGIANKDENGNILHDAAPVHFNNLIGKPYFTIPYLGYLSDYLSKPPGMYIGISVFIVLLMLMFIPDIINKIDENDKKKHTGPTS